MEQMVKKVQQNLRVVQDRQKRYADQKRRQKEFNVGEHVYLKVKAKRSSLKLGRCFNLASRFYHGFSFSFQLLAEPNLIFHSYFSPNVIYPLF
jgi:hypothetical protein